LEERIVMARDFEGGRLLENYVDYMYKYAVFDIKPTYFT